MCIVVFTKKMKRSPPDAETLEEKTQAAQAEQSQFLWLHYGFFVASVGSYV